MEEPMSRPLSIRVNTLPHRARPLDDRELSRVFGGCLEGYKTCTVHCDCCSGLCVPGYSECALEG